MVTNMNDYKSFKAFCETTGFVLTRSQKKIAKRLFRMAMGAGKSTIVALLFKFDPTVEKTLRQLK